MSNNTRKSRRSEPKSNKINWDPAARGKAIASGKATAAKMDANPTSPSPKSKSPKSNLTPSQRRAAIGSGMSTAAQMDAKKQGKPKPKPMGPSAHEARVNQRAARMEDRGNKRAQAAKTSTAPKPKPKPKAAAPKKAAPKKAAPRMSAEDKAADARSKAIVAGTKSANKMANARFNAAKNKKKSVKRGKSAFLS